MPQIRLVERMLDTPACCLTCGKGNVPDNSGEVQPAVDLGADVNWGDSTYLCNDCATIVGSQVGMLTQDDVQLLRQKNRSLRKKLHEANATIDAKRNAERAAVQRARAAEAVSS
jgi:hypothetical protein